MTTQMCEAAARIRAAKQELAEALSAQPITDIQLLAGWCLARDFAHLWATLVAPEEFGTEDVVTPAVIRGLVSERDQPDGMGGLEAPFLNEEGVLCHTTASGRLGWTINPDGFIVVTVYRPADKGKIEARLQARITGPDSMAVERVEIRCEGELEARHFEALHWTLKALVYEEEAKARVDEAQDAYFDEKVGRFGEELRRLVYRAEEVLEPIPEPDSTL